MARACRCVLTVLFLLVGGAVYLPSLARAESAPVPFGAASGSVYGERRIALVIGNSNYKHTARLRNPRNDAELMARTLRRTGFAVTKLLDADQAQMKRAMLAFGRALRGADAVGLFYYAGHGVQVKGLNYLIPVDAQIADEDEVRLQGISVNDFLATMENAKSRINIIILDACRNNPFARAFRSGTRGLAPVEAPSGSYIAYATAPGDVAADGDGRNSPYTQALVNAILKPGITIEKTFKLARRDVQRMTGKKQTPWETSSIVGDFYFQPVRGADGAGSATGGSADTTERQIELAYWNSIKDSRNRAAFATYLEKYPQGNFAALARLKIEELGQNPAVLSPSAGHEDREMAAGGAIVSPRPGTAVGERPGRNGAFSAPFPGPDGRPPRGRPGPVTGRRPPGERFAGGRRPPRPAREVFPDSSRRELTQAEVARLQCFQLWLARNEIYKRRGFCFSTKRAIRVFGNAGCVTRKPRLSLTERRNIRTIRTYEIRRRCRP